MAITVTVTITVLPVSKLGEDLRGTEPDQKEVTEERTVTPLTDGDYTVRDLTSRVVITHGETAPTVRARHQMHTELDTQLDT